MSKIFTAIGLMSGTSMDGIDAAIIRTDGEGHVERIGPSLFQPFTPSERDVVRQAQETARHLYRQIELSTTSATGFDFRVRNLSHAKSLFDAAENVVTSAHAKAVQALLRNANLTSPDVSIVGFHGQTLYHNPSTKETMQLGDGQALADKLGIPVVFDFRTADVKAGGQGAPLVPIYHQALVQAAQFELPVAVVNVGGVANVTYIGSEGELIAFDTGPGNALIDDWMAEKTGVAMDCGGACAHGGTFSERVLGQLLADPYFSLEPPKSLDRDHFKAFALQLVVGLSTEMGARTLTVFTVMSVARADFHFPIPPKSWIICGGGTRNETMMAEFRKRLSGSVLTADEVGWSSDFMEAEAFAYLAVRSLLGVPISFPTTTGVGAPLTGGRHVKPAIG